MSKIRWVTTVDEHAVSPVVGTLLLLVITMMLAGGAFLVSQETSAAVDEAPRIAFTQDPSGPGARFTVVAVDGLTGAADWSRVELATGSSATCTLPTGPLSAGDEVVCQGEGTLALSYLLASGDTVLIYKGEVR